MSFRVGELNSSYTAKVIQVASDLIVGRRRRELGMRN